MRVLNKFYRFQELDHYDIINIEGVSLINDLILWS